MQLEARNVYGATALVVIIYADIAVQLALGIKLWHASLACGIVAVCTLLSWLFAFRGKARSATRSFVTGAISGLVGTLIWPSGYWIWHCVTNMDHLQMGGIIVTFLGLLIIGSMVVGAAIATTLTLGFTDPN
jgi:hypothetical protein